MVKFLFLEGLIGSGKTSSLEYLKRRFSREMKSPLFVLEPVEEWQNLPTLEGQPVNLLNAFYGNIPKYGFCFQTYAFLSRMKILLETLKRAEEEEITWVICERSIFTDREIFLECLYENGSITPEERAVYHQLWDFWIGLIQPFFRDIELHFMYVHCDPETALEHIRTRSRSEEDNGIDLGYLQKLSQKHETMYGSENDGRQLFNLARILIGEKGVIKWHHINNSDGLAKLYGQLDELVETVLKPDETGFWVVNPRKIWNYWDMFWDTN